MSENGKHRPEECLRRWSSFAQFHIYVAQECNLRCVYCFNLQGTFGAPPKRMSAATARATVRFILERRNARAPVLYIRFFGGEPLLGRRAMFAIMRRLKKDASGQRLRFSVDTNGTLLDREALEFFESAGGVELNISLDGGQVETDACRRSCSGSTWNRVIGNVRLARNYGVELGATAVLTRVNPDAVKVIARLRDLGFGSITLRPVWPSPINERTAEWEMDPAAERVYLDSMTEALTGYFSQLRNAMREGHPPGYFLANAALILEAAKQPAAAPPRRRCSGGVPAIDCDGNVFPCAAMAHLPRQRIGHVSSGLDLEAVERFRRAALSVSEVQPCRTCWARLRCGGPCLQFASATDSLDRFVPLPAYCHMRKRELSLGLRALKACRREQGSTFPALLAYAQDWFGRATPPTHLNGGSPQGTG